MFKKQTNKNINFYKNYYNLYNASHYVFFYIYIYLTASSKKNPISTSLTQQHLWHNVNLIKAKYIIYNINNSR